MTITTNIIGNVLFGGRFDDTITQVRYDDTPQQVLAMHVTPHSKR